MLRNRISGLLLLIQILCISGVPHRFVDVENNQPTFLRNSVEFVPLNDEGQSGNLRDGAGYEEDDKMFSRSAVESIPSTIVSYYQPLRSAVEHNPLDDDEDFDIFTKPVSQKQKFLRIVIPKRNRKSKLNDHHEFINAQRNRNSKSLDFNAYVIPLPHEKQNYDRFRNDSPYQQLIDKETFEKSQQNRDQQQQQASAPLKAVAGKASEPRVVCHITNWSFYRKGEGKFVPENLDSKLCTHIIYSFATLEPEDLELREFDPWADIENQLYARTISMNKNVPVLLGMGGWTDSSGDKYTKMVSNPRARQNFIDRGIAFLRKYGFSGIHIDWNYPVCWQSDCRAGPANDKDNYTKFIKELRKALLTYKLLLSTSISGYKEIIVKAYDLPALSSSVDFMTVMSYDYHGSWESVTGHVSPLFGDEKDKYPQYNTDYAMKLLVKMGAEKEKLIVGVPFYGQTFMLSSTKMGQGFNSPSDGPGEPGEVTNQPGMLAYNEICNRLRRPVWKTGKDSTGKAGPYATDGSQWVGYDDVETIMMKTKYAINSGYGGVAAWTVDLDDFSNRCCLEPFPLLRAINRAIGRLNTPVPSGNDCTKPPPPVTPTPPIMAATVDTGAAGIPNQSTNEPSYNPSTTSSPWWNPTPAATTQTTTRRTTTENTTKRTTQRTTQRPTTTRRPGSYGETTIPVPVNVMPVLVDGPCDLGEHRAHPSKCSEYLVCSTNGELITLYCPAGLHWNDQNKNCDWPDSAMCTVENRPATQATTTTKTSRKPPKRTTSKPAITTRQPTTTTTTTTSTTTTTTRPTTRKTRRTTTTRPTTTYDSTTQYYDDTTTTRRPYYDTTKTTRRPYYDTTTTTLRPDYDTTSKKPAKKSPCVNGQYYPHKDCSKYYVCNNNKRTPSQCPEGTQFSNVLKTCDFTANVNCVSRKQYLKLLDIKFRTTGIFNAAYLRAQEGDVCKRGDGLHSHPTSCGDYLECLYEKMYKRPCPAELHFDPEHSVCNYPRDCQDTETNEIGDGDDGDYYEEGDYEDGEEEEEVEANLPPVFEFDQGKPPSASTSTTSRPSSTSMRTTSTSMRPSSSSFETIPVPDKVEPLKGPFKLVCYFTNWAWYRPGIGKYLPDNIDENLCTHIVYGFAVLNYDELTIKTHDSWADVDNKFYERVVAFKQKGIKVTLAIGGWNDSLGDKYSRLVRSAAARAKFIKHVIEFLEKYGFEGLDLDWEYPVCWQVDCKKGNPDEKQNFASLVKELSAAFKPRGLLLSSAVSPSKTVIDAGYDVPTLSKYFDWIAVMCYDYHGQWDKKTGHVAPLYEHPEDDVDFFNSEYTMRYWIKLGAPPNKLVMGMPLYGQSFTLADPKNHGLNAKAPGPGQAGEFTRAAGFLAYYEICDRILNKGWTVVQDPEGRMGPYAYKDNQWVSFDDQRTLLRKTDFIKELGIAGGMIWALDLDDFKNRCGQGYHPLLKVIHAGLKDKKMSGASYPHKPDKEPEPEYEDEEDEDAEIDQEHVNHESPVAVPDNSHKEPIEPHEPVPTGVDIDENHEDGEDYDDEDEDDEDNEIDPNNEVEDFKVVCYFTNWAWYRPGIGKFVPEDIDAELCSHIVYGFAVLNRDTLVIQPHDSWADIDNKFYERAVAFKRKGIKVTVAIGGWNDSAGDKYSRLVRDAAARARFIKHVIEFIEKYGFDGLDLDWEYPVCWQVECHKGMKEEKEWFADFVKEISAAFRPRGLLLSSAVSPSKKVIDAGYDIPKLTKYFDWIAVMAYDFHGQWDKKTGHVAPMYVHPESWEKTFNANFSINYWLEQGADRRKIIMGMPMYGQSFSLAERSNTGLNSQTYGGGEAGPETRARGFLSYYEICTNIRKKNWKVVRDLGGRIGPYAYSGDQWVSFDDAAMIRHKSEFVKALGLGGAMIWALDLDDFKNVCGCEEYPLLRTINRVLRKYPGPHNNCVLEPKKTITSAADPTKKPTTEAPTTKKPTTAMTTVKATTEMITTKKPTTRKTTTTTQKPTTTTRKASSTRKTTTTEAYDYHDIPELDDDDSKSSCDSGVQFMPHETDCNKYYQCLHGKPSEQSCAPSLHWNENRCDWPENSNCKSTVVTGEAGDAEEEEEEEETDEANDVNYNPPAKPPTYGPTTSKSTTGRTTTSRATARPSSTAPTRTTVKPTQRPQTEQTPVVLTGNEEYKMVCYFTNWAWYRPGIGKYKPDDIDSNLCTHIVYGFAVLNRDTLTIRTHDSWADIDNKFYERVAEFKQKGIKVTLAIGGWNDSLGDKYSRLVRDAAARARFIKHVIEFIEKYGFEGLDLDWEYPVCWQVDCDKGKKEEKQWFSDWVRELSEAFKPRGLLLSSAVSPSKKVIDAGYDIPTLSKYFDWIAVMCYDYHGQWDKKTGHVAPLHEHPDDWETTFNGEFSINYWIAKGASPKKLVMGMPMYGQSFTLEKVDENGLNAKAPGPGQAGEFTRAAGFLAFYEICDRVNRGGWTVVRDPEGRIGPYAYNGRQWVSYDDVEDIIRKTKFVKKMGLGGAMIWALDLDDFRNRCGCGYSPLLTSINLELGRVKTSRRSDCT